MLVGISSSIHLDTLDKITEHWIGPTYNDGYINLFYFI